MDLKICQLCKSDPIRAKEISKKYESGVCPMAFNPRCGFNPIGWDYDTLVARCYEFYKQKRVELNLLKETRNG